MTLQHSAPSSIQEKLVPLGEGRFRFACHPGVPCFTECCRELNLFLTPYDIVRMKRHLEMTAEAFIDMYCDVRFEEGRQVPMVYLAMRDNERMTCPFVSARGCGIYDDRPSACRTYPLARASRKHKLHGVFLENYFLLKEDHCRGFEEDRSWSVEEWIQDQGLAPYHAMNNLWMEIVTDTRLKRALAERQLQVFYLGSYDLDRFRSFVFGSRFLALFDLPETEVEPLRNDDEALLRLAFRWLRFSLFNDDSLRLRQPAAASP